MRPKRKRTRRMRRIWRLRRAGHAAGYRGGYARGYHAGRCHAVHERLSVPEPGDAPHDKSVMYVAQGTPGFRSIDRGIMNALGKLAREAIRVTSGDPVALLAELHRPDLVLVLNGIFSVGTDQIDRIRALGIPTAVWVADDPYFSDQTRQMAAHYDVVFTHEVSCVTMYREAGCRNVHYLPFAADPDLFRPVHPPALHTDLLFIGMAFPNRLAFLNRLAPFFARRNVLIAGGGWQGLAGYDRLKDRIWLAGIDPETTPLFYSGAKIVINLHRSDEESGNSLRFPGLSVNPRTFEIGACGTLQLVDERAELSRHYAPGTDVATFSSPEELMEKAEYYLKREEERRQLAVNALKRTLRAHTYVHRLKHMFQLLSKPGGVWG